ncbi:MAG: hypothetical protein JNK75_09165 [Betaproteobacteria bacterium]|nr:hypothetical protein [Betaproteobacteria bacterium]
MGRTGSQPQRSAQVVCKTPTPGKAPVAIEAWKHACVRRAILDVLPRDGDGMRFIDLPDAVRRQLGPEELRTLGSVSWYVTTVKLDLEVKGEVRRQPGTPQRLVRTR